MDVGLITLAMPRGSGASAAMDNGTRAARPALCRVHVCTKRVHEMCKELCNACE